MTRDRNELEVLSSGECLDLLCTQAVGRVGLSVGALPVVLPVNFVVDGEHIILRTGFGTKLSAALRNAVVCFEVDDIDQRDQTGWSVLVTGTAHELVGTDAAHAATLPLRPWPGSTADHLVAISIDLVSGRRIVPAVQLVS